MINVVTEIRIGVILVISVSGYLVSVQIDVQLKIQKIANKTRIVVLAQWNKFVYQFVN